MSKQTPEEVVELLSPDMQYTLGCMAEWDDESLIGYTLDNLPLGTRSALHAYEVTELSSNTGYGLRLTRFGRKVTRACFEKHQGYIQFRDAQLERAQVRRNAKELPESLQETLAMLAPCTTDFIETAIILMPRSHRETLAEHEIIETNLDGALDDPVEVKLTGKGHLIVLACAYLHLPEAMKQKVDELESEQRQYWEERFKNRRLSRFVTRPGDLRRRK